MLRTFSMLSIFSLLLLLLLLCRDVEAKSKRPGRASKNDPDVIQYASEEDKNAKLQELKTKTLERSRDTSRLESEQRKLKSEEEGLRNDVLRAIVNHGDDSKQKAQALHKLGRNIYQQERFDETFQMSREILRIHSVLDGPESGPFADALGNVGSVAHRVKNKKLCEIAMKRQLRILLDKHGAESKEVLIQRARMMSFQIKDGEVSDGFSQLDYEDEMEDYEASVKAELAEIEGDEL